MEMSHETIKVLLDAFDRSDWEEMTVTIGADRLHVSRTASSNGTGSTAAVPVSGSSPATTPPPADGRAEAPAAPAAAPAAAPEATAVAASPPAADTPPGITIESPSVGLFWRAPAPGAEPFVEVGQRVAAGETVAIVEVMKLMNHVVSPADGTVAAILVENGAGVEHGQALVVVDPQG